MLAPLQSVACSPGPESLFVPQAPEAYWGPHALLPGPFTPTALLGPAGDGDQVDAVTVARAVRQIMPEVGAIDADALAVW